MLGRLPDWVEVVDVVVVDERREGAVGVSGDEDDEVPPAKAWAGNERIATDVAMATAERMDFTGARHSS